MRLALILSRLARIRNLDRSGGSAAVGAARLTRRGRGPASQIGFALKESLVANGEHNSFLMNQILFGEGPKTASKLVLFRKSSARLPMPRAQWISRRRHDARAFDVQLPFPTQGKRRRRIEGSSQNWNGFKGKGMFLGRERGMRLGRPSHQPFGEVGDAANRAGKSSFRPVSKCPTIRSAFLFASLGNQTAGESFNRFVRYSAIGASCALSQPWSRTWRSRAVRARIRASQISLTAALRETNSSFGQIPILARSRSFSESNLAPISACSFSNRSRSVQNI